MRSTRWRLGFQPHRSNTFVDPHTVNHKLALMRSVLRHNSSSGYMLKFLKVYRIFKCKTGQKIRYSSPRIGCRFFWNTCISYRLSADASSWSNGYISAAPPCERSSVRLPADDFFSSVQAGFYDPVVRTLHSALIAQC